MLASVVDMTEWDRKWTGLALEERRAVSVIGLRKELMTDRRGKHFHEGYFIWSELDDELF